MGIGDLYKAKKRILVKKIKGKYFFVYKDDIIIFLRQHKTKCPGLWDYHFLENFSYLATIGKFNLYLEKIG